jgi:hypothetical protein
MAVHRRSLVLSAAAALILPACISVSARPEPITPAELAARITAESAARAIEPVRKSGSDFAIFHPSRPGEIVPTKPVAKDATTVQKTAPLPVAPVKSELVGPVPPPNPFTHTSAASTPAARDPGVFPLTPRSAIGTESPLVAAFRAHLEGKPERAFEAISGLDRANQELILAILPVLSRGASANLAADPQAAAALVDQLHAAADRIEPFATLRVDAALLCHPVDGFGRYVPWPVNKPYLPNDRAQLYLEVRNLLSQPAAGPRGQPYLTHARGRAEIRDAYGKLVPQPHPDDYRRRVDVVEFEEKKRTHSPVQDFHILYAFPVPATPGVYTITVTVSDAAGRRSVTTQPVEFRVAGG